MEARKGAVKEERKRRRRKGEGNGILNVMRKYRAILKLCILGEREKKRDNKNRIKDEEGR